MSNVKALPVITTKSLKINLAKIKGPNGIAAPLYRVIALLSGAELKRTNLGDSIKFSGDIEVTVFETGEILRGSVIYLPAVAEVVIDQALKKGISLQVAMEIGAEPSDTVLGYRFTVSGLNIEVSKALSDFASTLPPIN